MKMKTEGMLEISILRNGYKTGTVGWLATGLEDGSITLEEGRLRDNGHHGLWLSTTGNIQQFLAAYDEYDRLYLLETVQWLKITRTGSWSAWQTEAEGWDCDEGWQCVLMSDAEVAQEYKLDEIISCLAKTLTDLSREIPERMTRIQQRIEMASRLLAEISKDK